MTKISDNLRSELIEFLEDQKGKLENEEDMLEQLRLVSDSDVKDHESKILNVRDRQRTVRGLIQRLKEENE